MTSIRPILRKTEQWFSGLNSREKSIVSVALVAAIFYIAFLGLTELNSSIEHNSRLAQNRLAELPFITQAVKRYKELEQKQEALQNTFAQSQMTFEQTFSYIDRVARETSQSESPELKQGRAPTPFGLEYEKQDFTLVVRAIKIDQLVALLYRIEQGERPLFLSRVQLTKSPAGTDYTATLEIYSIAKRVAGTPSA